jgi:hypothetical protein
LHQSLYLLLHHEPTFLSSIGECQSFKRCLAQMAIEQLRNLQTQLDGLDASEVRCRGPSVSNCTAMRLLGLP